MPRDTQLEPATRDYTVNLHKRLHRVTFKRKAPRAIKVIKKFAKVNMLTDVFIILIIVTLLGCPCSY